MELKEELRVQTHAEV